MNVMTLCFFMIWSRLLSHYLNELNKAYTATHKKQEGGGAQNVAYTTHSKTHKPQAGCFSLFPQ